MTVSPQEQGAILLAAVNQLAEQGRYDDALAVVAQLSDAARSAPSLPDGVGHLSSCRPVRAAETTVLPGATPEACSQFSDDWIDAGERLSPCQEHSLARKGEP